MAMMQHSLMMHVLLQPVHELHELVLAEIHIDLDRFGCFLEGDIQLGRE